MPVIKPLLLGILLPAAVAAAMLLLWRRVAGRPATPTPSFITPVALALGFVAGFVAILGPPRFPARERLDWLPLLAIAAAGVGIAERLRPGRSGLVWMTRLAFAALAVGMLVRPVLAPREGLPLSVAAICAAAAIGILCAWGVMARAATGPRRPGLAVDLAVVAAAAGVALFLSYNAKLAQLAGALAAVLAAAGLLGQSLAPMAHASVAVPAVVLSSLLLLGAAGGELPVVSAVLLAAAPGAVLTTDVRPVSTLPATARMAIRAAVLVGLVALGVALAVPAAG